LRYVSCLFVVLGMMTVACNARATRWATPAPTSSPASTHSAFTPRDLAVGDPNVSYANIEFTADYRYLVWFEMARDDSTTGTVWHCGVNLDTGELIPADGKGFRAFESTVWGRANPGRDAEGVYYIGANREGRLVFVRPTGATSGTVTVLPTPADLTRRGIYPTDLPAQQGGYVFWIKNERVPGGGLDPRNRWFELRYLDLAHPEKEIVIERQEKPARGFAPMDIGFARWFRGAPLLTFGAFDEQGRVQIKQFDATSPTRGTVMVTSDAHSHIDPFPFVFGDQHVIVAGIDGTATSQVYARASHAIPFAPVETIAPPHSTLPKPVLAQSHERILFDGKAYTAYQVNDGSAGRANFFETTFARTGEIWLTTVLQSPQQQWLISSRSDTAKSEPEPFIGKTRVWVFYSETSPDSSPGNALWSLRRADTPLRKE